MNMVTPKPVQNPPVEEKYKLKFKADECRTFLRLFPFIVGPMVDLENQYYKFILELIELVNLIFAPVITTLGIEDLKAKIDFHLTQFKVLFPEMNLLPKHHYLIHIPRSILRTNHQILLLCF